MPRPPPRPNEQRRENLLWLLVDALGPPHEILADCPRCRAPALRVELDGSACCSSCRLFVSVMSLCNGTWMVNEQAAAAAMVQAPRAR